MVGTSPQFTVVIPTYNRAASLRSAVRSVLAQTFTDFEMIVIDDGSTDDTLDTLDTFDDSRLRVVSQPNTGVAAARNVGIGLARGGVVTFLDSDDEALPGWLQCFVGPFDDPNCLLAFCGMRTSERRGSTGSVLLPSWSAWHKANVLFLSGTFAVRRELFEAAGGYLDGLTFAENSELGIRLIATTAAWNGHSVAVYEPMIVVHRDLSGGSAPHRADSILRVLDTHRDHFAATPARLARWLSIAAVDEVRKDNCSEARRLFYRAWRARPLSLKSTARLVVASVPTLARRVWRPTSP